MRGSIRAALAAAACALAVLATGNASAATEPPGGVPLPPHSCQRDCLQGAMDKYLAAMAAHKVDPALFAANVRFTENGVELPFGTEGLWATASGVGHYKFYVPDVETQQVAFMGTMMETASSSAAGPARKPDPVGIDVRLRLDAQGKISEVEQIVARPDRPLGPVPAASSPFPATGEAVEAMGAPNEVFLQDVPENQRMSRADLIAVANQYFTGMQRNDGKGYYPFTDDCLRHENGMISAGPPGTPGGLGGRPVQTCKGQFETSLKGVVTGIRDRRFVAVDRQKGIVFAFAAFDHRPIDWTWELGELFKIEGNKIRRIEAIFIRGPYGVCSGWDTYQQCRSEEIQDVR